MELPVAYASNSEQFWVEFPAPWPNAIVSGTLECGFTSNFKLTACAAINGDAAVLKPARIYISGLTITSASSKLIIRGIANPPNKDTLPGVIIKYRNVLTE